ncbi:MAG TPA: COX15/CtaA family protein, partial [Candidatus Dormibacteraeota bacterium]
MKTFRGLAVVAAVAVYLQVVLGSVVRITGSGLGCPDWPLCHGAIVPAFEYHTMIEYAHRLVGTSAGLLMVATAGCAFVLYRRGIKGEVPGGLVVASVGALLLIVAQGIVGGITVLMKNSPFTVAIHLGNAELVLGAAILVALWAARAARGRIAIPTRRLGTPVILVGLAGAYLVVVTGAIVVGTGASGACSSWPLCGGTGRLADTHMLHRAVVLLGSLAILGAVHSARRRWRGQRLGVAAYVVGALLVAEVAVGAAQVLNGLPAALRSIHVALASGVWGGMVLL